MVDTLLFGSDNIGSINNKSLKKLFADIAESEIDGNVSLIPKRIVTDSRRVSPGSLFFAIPGRNNDGSDFIEEAIDRGAIAVVTEQKNILKSRVPYVKVNNVRRALALVSLKYYDYPDKKLELIGVTGTNGKTSVTMISQFILNTRKKAGLIGTIYYDLGGRTIPSYRTTPESIDICRMLKDMHEAACSCALMEVSSHGLDQLRVSDLEFDIGVFMNLTHEHLDYHSDMENYFQAKRKLFIHNELPITKLSIINQDDVYGLRLAEELKSVGNNVITFGSSEDADLYVKDIILKSDSSEFCLNWKGKSYKIKSPLVGRYNVDNWMASVLIAIFQGFKLEDAAKVLHKFTGVPGRLQKVDSIDSFSVLVDYAHTPEALEYSLETVRQICEGNLYVVFGCGGDRDRSKRAPMTSAVASKAHFAWATADNPRSEKLDDIFKDMQSAEGWQGKMDFVEDRRLAIRLAIERCKPGDTLVIAGKGHETYQAIGSTVIPFDDTQVVRELWEAKKILKK